MSISISSRTFTMISLSLWIYSSVAPSFAAESYPNRPIKIIVPFPPGGNPDIATRIVGSELAKAVKQPVVVENRAGASGGIGVHYVVNEKPDGYTLLGANLSVLAINPAVFDKLSYDPQRDLVPVAQLAISPLVLISNSAAPFNSVDTLIDLAKKAPGSITYSSSGIGTGSHLAGGLFNQMAGTDIRHIPYRGAAGAASDVASGEVSINFGGQGPAWALVASGRVRALATTGVKRTDEHPETPTVSESGLPGYNIVDWTGLLAPTGTPSEVVDFLNREVVKILHEPAVVTKLKIQGLEAAPGSPKDFSNFISAEQKKWGGVAHETGIHIEQ